jgi:hypothetical protein
MKRRVPALLLLALTACAPPPKHSNPDESRVEDFERAVVMAVGVQETTQLKMGQWVLYSVRSEGSTASFSTRIAVVAAGDGTYWIENRTVTPGPGGTSKHTVISKFQIDASAKPLQLWVGELPTPRPTKVFPGKDARGNPIEPPKASPPDSRIKVDIARELVSLSPSKQFDCTRLTSKVVYPDGKETKLVTWCCKDVPFSAVHEGKLYGGVVRRTYGRHTLELVAMGTDAVPELTIPEK